MLRGNARAVAVADFRRDRERGRFGATGDVDGALGVHRPRMEQVQVLRVLLEQVFLGQPGAIVLGGEAGDVVGGLGRGAQRRRREIGRAGVAAPLADHHRHANHLVAVLLDRLHLALAHRHRQAAAFGDLGGGVGRPKLACHAQHIGRHGLELVLGIGEMRGFVGNLVHAVVHVGKRDQKSKRES
ncbi:hypothetical protein D3C72_1707600 [compost metagenome]